MLLCKNDPRLAVTCLAFPISVTGYMVTTEITVIFYFHFSPFNLVISFHVTFRTIQYLGRVKRRFYKVWLIMSFSFLLTFLLKQSSSTMLYQFQVYGIVILYFCRLYPIINYYKIMSIIPCAIQYILVAYLFYTQQFFVFFLKFFFFNFQPL